MARISASETKRIIAQIKRRTSSPTDDLARWGLLHRASAPVTRSGEFRRALEQAGMDIKKIVEKAGLDIGKLDKIRKREQGRLRKTKRAAAKKVLASINDDSFRHGIQERVKTWKLLSALPDQVDHVVLDTPILIWANPYGILDDWKIEPQASTAKFHFYEQDIPEDLVPLIRMVSFYFLWQNNYGQEVMINAETFFLIRGHLSSSIVDRGFIQAGSTAIDMVVGLDMSELWNQPNTRPLPEQSQFIYFSKLTFADVFVYFGIPISLNEDSEATVLQIVNPARNGYFIVPKNGSVVFQAFVAFEIYGRKVEIAGDVAIENFGDFGPMPNQFIECPLVRLEVIVPPIVT
jgi:hypothetical protein